MEPKHREEQRRLLLRRFNRSSLTRQCWISTHSHTTFTTKPPLSKNYHIIIFTYLFLFFYGRLLFLSNLKLLLVTHSSLVIKVIECCFLHPILLTSSSSSSTCISSSSQFCPNHLSSFFSISAFSAILP